MSNPPPYNPQPQPYPQPYPQTYPQSHPQPYYPPPQQPMPQQQPTVVVTSGVVPGTCPKCNRGVLTKEYTVCGIILAICFFPIGILCCIAMRENRCNVCRASY